MPTTMGVYTAAKTAGSEVSSTYEGRHLTVLETELVHPFRAGGFVNKGDPVIIALADIAGAHGVKGHAVGVALATATAQTDYIAVDTEGIFNLDVCAFDDSGGATGVVNPGDPLYISDDTAQAASAPGYNGVGDAVISKIKNRALQVPFGYALGQINSAAHGVIAVKVHWDPSVAEEQVGVSGGEWASAVPNKTFRSYHYEATGGQYINGEVFKLTIPTGALRTYVGIAKNINLTISGDGNVVTGYAAVEQLELVVQAGAGELDTMTVLQMNNLPGIWTGTGHNNFLFSWLRMADYAPEKSEQINNFFELNDTLSVYPVANNDDDLFVEKSGWTISHCLKIFVNGVKYWIGVSSQS